MQAASTSSRSGSTVVVIGSGPAGASAAAELVRQGATVTLLETGTAMPSGLLVRLNGRNLGRRQPPLDDVTDSFVASGDPATAWPRYRQPGGMSNQWTAAVPRFADDDFTDGARLGEQYRWPFTAADLAPFYERAEAVLHVSGPVESHPLLPAGAVRHRRHLPPGWSAVRDVAEAHGQALVPTPVADGPRWLVVRRSTSFNSYHALVAPLVGRPRFTLLLGATALRLEWDGVNRRVAGVVYHDGATGSQRRIGADAVVVAAGALQSCKLLLDSACADFPDGLGNDAGLLGAYVHDHPKEWWPLDLDPSIEAPHPTVYLTRLPHAASEPLMGASWTIGAARSIDRVRTLTRLPLSRLGVQIFGTMVPTDQVALRASSDRHDEFGLPLLDVDLCFDDAALDNVRRARRHLLDVLEAAGFAPRPGDIVDQLHPGGAAHYGGGVRMHSDPRFGVLDAWNRVHDVPNVLVVDASCFTTSPEKNPTLTAMAIAVRAASRLADDLRLG